MENRSVPVRSESAALERYEMGPTMVATSTTAGHATSPALNTAVSAGLSPNSLASHHAAGQPVSPRRRENVPQPPSLTTSLNGLQFQRSSLVSATPSSALSNPYSRLVPSSPFNPSYEPSPIAAFRGTSPMGPRLSGFSSTYNPGEWGPANDSPTTSPYPQTNPHVRQPLPSDETAPPPYSPPDESRRREGQNLESSSSEPNPARLSQYIPAATGVTVPAETAYAAQQRHAQYNGFELPPPPPRSSSSQPNARSGRRFTTEDGPVNRGPSQLVDRVLIAPSSKRASSASAISSSGLSSRMSDRSASNSPGPHPSWEPGMPLPGPPPGPPPSASRSQSAGGVDRFARQPMPGARRQAPHLGTALGPVPPTPANWVENHTEPDSATDSAVTGPSLTFSPTAISSGTTSSHSETAHTFFRGGRDPSAKGIRERRSESRGAQARVVDEEPASFDPNRAVIPADLPLVTGGILTRRRTITKSVQRARGSRSGTLEDQINSAASEDQSEPQTGSSRTTPRAESARHNRSNQSVHTPPFSPTESVSSGKKPTSAHALSPRGLPTPPLQQGRAPISLNIPSAGLQIRPISHILHLPNDASGSMSAPLSPRRTHSRTNSSNALTDHDTFIRDCLDRTKAFLDRELNAESDEERLRLFSEHILTESRIRRRRYAQNFASFDSRPTRDRLFELNMHAPRRSSGLQETTLVSPIEPSPVQDALVPPSPSQNKNDSQWWNSYQPQLSPIASMSMNDEEDSRGRAPSRWWESQTGSDAGGRGGRMERSKRESKYMGLPLRQAQQAVDYADSESGPSQQVYGIDEYPPEKVGWHDAETTPGLPSALVTPSQPSPKASLDVSRLVTLPPPFPRHYPAVQNQHPDLLAYRTLVRTVSDLAEIESRRTRYQSSMEALRKESQDRVVENRRNFKVNIQAQIQEGSITFAEAAEAEAAMQSDEIKAEKARVQAEFDSFKDVVVNPVHSLLNDRILKTTQHINELHRKLHQDAQLHNPNETQSAGDERPELLEQLTQLKWLFEAREQLHREAFNLMTERNSKYQAIVTLPYQQAGVLKEAKLRETVTFFAKDTQDRTIAFETESLSRHQHFQTIIEENVLRGLEAQLSAFWDIAPGLLTICQKIPDSKPSPSPTSSWHGIHIPSTELAENPTYTSFPMQYLYSLLRHAERSTYQFIESQINLLCLLHEARSGTTQARIRVWEVSRLAEVAGLEAPIAPPTPGSAVSVALPTPTTANSVSTPGLGSARTPAGTPLASPRGGAGAGAGVGAGAGAGALVSPRSVVGSGGGGGEAKSAAAEAVILQARERRAREEAGLTAELKERVTSVEGQWSEALGSAIAGVRGRVKGWLVADEGWDDELDID